MEKVGSNRNALYLILPRSHVQSQYQSLFEWHGSWTEHLPLQQRQHRGQWQLPKMTNRRTPLLLQVPLSFSYFEGHLVQDQDHHHLNVKMQKETLRLWLQPQDVHHSFDQVRSDLHLRFKKQQWQSSQQSSLHWKWFLGTSFVHMSISFYHTIALFQHFRRSMIRLKRTFRLQTPSGLPWKKVLFSFFFVAMRWMPLQFFFGSTLLPWPCNLFFSCTITKLLLLLHFCCRLKQY